MTTKEIALTICEKIQNEYPKRPIWQTMLEIEDLIEKHVQEQLSIRLVSNCAEDKEPIIAKITNTAFTTPSNHGILSLKLNYGYYKMEGWEVGDKLEIKHCY